MEKLASLRGCPPASEREGHFYVKPIGVTHTCATGAGASDGISAVKVLAVTRVHPGPGRIIVMRRHSFAEQDDFVAVQQTVMSRRAGERAEALFVLEGKRVSPDGDV